MTSKTTDQHSEENAAYSNSLHESLGAQLRRAREARGLSLSDIAEETRISRRYLEAIESDNYAKLPGGIFNRSFIKTYARKVGVDETRALEDYSREMRERGTEGEEVSPSRQKQPIYTGEVGRPPLGKFLLSLLVAAIIAGGAYLFKQWNDKRSGNTPVPAANVTANKNANIVSNANSNTVAPGANISATSSVVASANALRIVVKARGEDLWIRSYTDNGNPITKILKANEIEEFTPQKTFRVQFSRSKTNVFDMTINGAPVKATPATKGLLFEFDVNKNNVAELLKTSATSTNP